MPLYLRLRRVSAATNSICPNCGFPRAVPLVVLFGANAARIFVPRWHHPVQVNARVGRINAAKSPLKGHVFVGGRAGSVKPAIGL